MVGAPADAANAMLYAFDGNFGEAGWSALGVVPFAEYLKSGRVFAKGGKLDDVAETATEPNRIYSARELVRRADEPGPFHNFPESFNDGIFKGKRTVIKKDYVQYSQRGSLNGRSGTFEIGVKPSASGRTEVITHRFFRPDPRQ